MTDNFVPMRRYCSQETIQQMHILARNRNQNLLQRKALYLHGFVQQHDSCFKNKLKALVEDPECLLESNKRLSAENKIQR